MENKIAWVILAEKVGTNKKLAELAKNFEKKKENAIPKSVREIDLINKIKSVTSRGCSLITYMDEEYPQELRDIAYPPAYLFARGNVSLLKYPVKVSIVGSREASAYGINVAADFAHELAANKLCIVTGGAKGIDTAAIRGAMRIGGKVIVVVGTGIDTDYPKENAELFEQVVQSGGLIVSEFPVGMGPLPRNFPQRNRIMTAVSDAVVIVEAAKRSGALISASHALEQGKQLYAVPGNIDSPNSKGVNELLREGALFALCATDILNDLMEALPDKVRHARAYEEKPLNKENSFENKAENIENTEKPVHISVYENAVFNAIKSGKDTYEGILEYTNMEAKKLTSLLTIMEIKGIIKLAFGNRYKIIG